jgi:hypothetical protein
MQIKLSYPVKEVVKIIGGVSDFNLTSDGSIIAVYGKPHRNEIYKLHAGGKKVEKFIDRTPLFPISIHVENSGDIIVRVVKLICGRIPFMKTEKII